MIRDSQFFFQSLWLWWCQKYLHFFRFFNLNTYCIHWIRGWVSVFLYLTLKRKSCIFRRFYFLGQKNSFNFVSKIKSFLNFFGPIFGLLKIEWFSRNFSSGFRLYAFLLALLLNEPFQFQYLSWKKTQPRNSNPSTSKISIKPYLQAERRGWKTLSYYMLTAKCIFKKCWKKKIYAKITVWIFWIQSFHFLFRLLYFLLGWENTKVSFKTKVSRNGQKYFRKHHSRWLLEWRKCGLTIEFFVWDFSCMQQPEHNFRSESRDTTENEQEEHPSYHRQEVWLNLTSLNSLENTFEHAQYVSLFTPYELNWRPDKCQKNSLENRRWTSFELT